MRVLYMCLIAEKQTTWRETALKKKSSPDASPSHSQTASQILAQKQQQEQPTVRPGVGGSVPQRPGSASSASSSAGASKSPSPAPPAPFTGSRPLSSAAGVGAGSSVGITGPGALTAPPPDLASLRFALEQRKRQIELGKMRQAEQLQLKKAGISNLAFLQVLNAKKQQQQQQQQHSQASSKAFGPGPGHGPGPGPVPVASTAQSVTVEHSVDTSRTVTLKRAPLSPPPMNGAPDSVVLSQTQPQLQPLASGKTTFARTGPAVRASLRVAPTEPLVPLVARSSSRTPPGAAALEREQQQHQQQLRASVESTPPTSQPQPQPAAGAQQSSMSAAEELLNQVQAQLRVGSPLRHQQPQPQPPPQQQSYPPVQHSPRELHQQQQQQQQQQQPGDMNEFTSSVAKLSDTLNQLHSEIRTMNLQRSNAPQQQQQPPPHPPSARGELPVLPHASEYNFNSYSARLEDPYAIAHQPLVAHYEHQQQRQHQQPPYLPSAAGPVPLEQPLLLQMAPHSALALEEQDVSAYPPRTPSTPNSSSRPRWQVPTSTGYAPFLFASQQQDPAYMAQQQQQRYLPMQMQMASGAPPPVPQHLHGLPPQVPLHHQTPRAVSSATATVAGVAAQAPYADTVNLAGFDPYRTNASLYYMGVPPGMGVGGRPLQQQLATRARDDEPPYPTALNTPYAARVEDLPSPTTAAALVAGAGPPALLRHQSSDGTGAASARAQQQAPNVAALFGPRSETFAGGPGSSARAMSEMPPPTGPFSPTKGAAPGAPGQQFARVPSLGPVADELSPTGSFLSPTPLAASDTTPLSTPHQQQSQSQEAQVARPAPVDFYVPLDEKRGAAPKQRGGPHISPSLRTHQQPSPPLASAHRPQSEQPAFSSVLSQRDLIQPPIAAFELSARNLPSARAPSAEPHAGDTRSGATMRASFVADTSGATLAGGTQSNGRAPSHQNQNQQQHQTSSTPPVGFVVDMSDEERASGDPDAPHRDRFVTDLLERRAREKAQSRADREATQSVAEQERR